MFLLADSILQLAHLVLVKIYSRQKISQKKINSDWAQCNQMGRHVLQGGWLLRNVRWLDAFKTFKCWICPKLKNRTRTGWHGQGQVRLLDQMDPGNYKIGSIGWMGGNLHLLWPINEQCKWIFSSKWRDFSQEFR